jgi:hypothetical protein
MAKALRSFPEYRRKEVAEHRVMKATGGLGYWGAHDYLHPKTKAKKEK